MINVLINAYSCSPNRGSEPGMAWNWIEKLSSHCNLYIITEGEFKEIIERTLLTHPNKDRMHFHYVLVSEKVRGICRNQGNWFFYYYYEKWQRQALDLARRIANNIKLDIIHQLNMIGFREPGYLWKLSKERNIPYIWGPVDAKESFPVSYLKGAPLGTKCKMLLKNSINKIQLRYSYRVHQAAKHASYVISASSESVYSFKKYFGIDSLLINETGCFLPSSQSSNDQITNEMNGFNILWVGKDDFRKMLTLAIESLQYFKDTNDIKLHIVGVDCCSPYKEIAEDFEVTQKIVWHGAIMHEEVLDLMKACDILLFTSIAEGTPHVVLEAISNCLPVVCHNNCGHGDTITEEIGIKIPLSDPKHSAIDFSKAIQYLYSNRDVLDNKKQNCKKIRLSLSWNQKVNTMLEIYNKSLRIS